MSKAPNRPRRPGGQEPDAPGVPARRAALKLLDAVLRRGLALEQALDSAAQGLAPNDRGLAHAIAAESLRRLPDLDALIDSATQRDLPEDAKARFALRIALVQALALGTPGHAAIATVLPLVDGGPRKLVHGVFGTLSRQGATLPEPPTLPDPVALRWHAAWGDQMIEDAERAIAVPPPLDLTLRDPARAPDLPGQSLLPGHLRLDERASVPGIEGYGEGDWWVQDLAASLPARLLGKGAGTALDLCAAPGGKTLQLAAAGWEVTAVDISESRLARLAENLDRTGLKADVVAADLLRWQPSAPADAVLLDAPCSATGIFRRHPDVLHRVRPSLIAEMAALQTRLLARAALWVKPGGALVFSTCSLEPQEGEAQLDAFLAAHPDFALDPVRGEELPRGIAPRADGSLRLLPGMLADQGGLDGFFIARLRRTG
ncbi:16S rRNA (cytosine967-C5)-methyltransferase [Sphingomonas naasensis]|uniref:Methyltransferase domain-containing protein n=1 Tax=Sphingomonas naasensis TaxID=1344951 RepID=A0A4S1WA53_9SPHN|nr:transcription antitermination factor NusB [Sphingomonas naasensis]NIJ21334.1 16S rRNA (cytosine967-C5)-methyltransferase [Sphingomonas naasensis]TGX38765.1 methyltransferase domain-containing protein [Sphingomonas naasensis]